jgi:uncharacterized membrane protein HdeD (DUF308 family)
MVSLFFVPAVELASGEILYHFNLKGFASENGEAIDRQWSLTLFGILVCLLNGLIIFMYRSRVLQMRLCIYNMILIIGMAGVCLYIVRMSPKDAVYYHLPVVFPAIAVILHYLAFRSIRKDELMVQALSRLR